MPLWKWNKAGVHDLEAVPRGLWLPGFPMRQFVPMASSHWVGGHVPVTPALEWWRQFKSSCLQGLQSKPLGGEAVGWPPQAPVTPSLPQDHPAARERYHLPGRCTQPGPWSLVSRGRVPGPSHPASPDPASPPQGRPALEPNGLRLGGQRPGHHHHTGTAGHSASRGWGAREASPMRLCSTEGHCSTLPSGVGHLSGRSSFPRLVKDACCSRRTVACTLF